MTSNILSSHSLNRKCIENLENFDFDIGDNLKACFQNLVKLVVCLVLSLCIVEQFEKLSKRIHFRDSCQQY